MKIVAFSNLFPPVFIGGYEIGASQVVEELRRRGHDVLVLTAHEYFLQQENGYLHREHAPAERATLLNAGLCVFGSLSGLLKRQPLGTLRRVLASVAARRHYNRKIREFSPDAFLVFNPLGLIAPVLDDFVMHSKELGAPVYAYVSDHWVSTWPRGNPVHPMLHRMYTYPRRSVRFAAKVLHKVLNRTGWSASPHPLLDGYFYCSNYIRKLSQENSIGIADHEVAHWGLPAVERLPSVPAEHFSSSSPLTILFAGQLLPHKGLKVLLRALLYCQKPHRLVVIGDDATDYAAQCKALAARFGLGDRVLFVGRKKHAEMLDLMARTGQVLVVPSEWEEPFSIVVLEGMGIGLPVIASQTGGTAEGIEDGQNGFLFPKGDSRALAARIDRLEADRELCRRVGGLARQEILSGYTIPGLVDKIVARITSGAEPGAREDVRPRLAA